MAEKMTMYSALKAIATELEVANKIHNPEFASLHEAYAVLLEEVEEMWDGIKRNQDPKLVQEECVQIGAMVIKTLMSNVWKQPEEKGFFVLKSR